MANDSFLERTDIQRVHLAADSEPRSAANHQRELSKMTEIQLREALGREEALLRQKDDLIERLVLSQRESVHRLLNGMQTIVSLLSLQSRSTTDPEAETQLTVAADRVATIARVHRRLHYLNGVQSVAFKQYLNDLCRDLSAMWTMEGRSEPAISFEGMEIDLPTTSAIPLGFIVSELITNAAKYGKGRIAVTLTTSPDKRFALSVSSDGSRLPAEFDFAASKGLGMKIIGAFVNQINGELRIVQARGTRFTVLFS
jgi:two-component sensor histidine kinase